jgi:hypothetical protein
MSLDLYWTLAPLLLAVIAAIATAAFMWWVGPGPGE